MLHHAATVFIPFIYFPYLGFSKNERYAGKKVVENYKKSTAREWIDAAAFAIVAATLIRTFVFEAYTIPTPSMEKTLLVNDFLFVNSVSTKSSGHSGHKSLSIFVHYVPKLRKCSRPRLVVFSDVGGKNILHLHKIRKRISLTKMKCVF